MPWIDLTYARGGGLLPFDPMESTKHAPLVESQPSRDKPLLTMPLLQC